MSSKPASVGAPRAGVPGAPRVLVYVADPRQLEPGAAGPDLSHAAGLEHSPAAAAIQHLDTQYLSDNLQHNINTPKNALFRTHSINQSDQRNLPNTFFYKSLNENDTKISVYGSDGVVQRTDFYPVSQQYDKKSLKDDSENDLSNVSIVKPDCTDPVTSEFCGVVDAFNTRNHIPDNNVNLAAFHARCMIPVVSDASMSTVQTVQLQHGQNQFSESVTVLNSASGASSSSEQDFSLGKSYVNYQILEQSVSHQSIVNQSISILNQQVGVTRGIDSDSGNSPQYMRTPDGVVLAVLPTPNLDLQEQTSASDSPQTIIVPLGWKRIVNGITVLYISPSGTVLSTLQQLRDYLQTTGTCKCGLPCPLRPETTFSFDSKVVSKPYQAATGAELTKLCNHKRKLLATLQARAQSPATPPPQIEQKRVSSTEVAVVKKKMKKRSNLPVTMNVSQLMTQRERPINEFKLQETENNREVLFSAGHHRSNNGQITQPSFTPTHQNVMSNVSVDSDNKQDMHMQRSSHYLTVNSGWITHVESLENAKKMSQAMSGANSSLGVGMPVLGTNGQIIGVNTGINKHTSGYRNTNITNTLQNVVDQDQKEEKKDMLLQQNIQSDKYPYKEESQIYCGLNQPLTPEVMQKINEQQQIFIQQNQKQIEIAMKGYRSQLAENVTHGKVPTQHQYMSQGQLVIHNGAVVKSNPAKTPPWQVKRNDANGANQMTSPSQKVQRLELEYEEVNTNISEDSSSSFSSFSSNEPLINQNMCSRVPPLPQHYNMIGQQWPNLETHKKKSKNNSTSKSIKKKSSPTDSKMISFGSNGMRIPDTKTNTQDDIPANNIPSFMDDPTGYLAQQTALLNNTISKQVGINSSYEGSHYETTSCNNYVGQNSIEKGKSMVKSGDLLNVYKNNISNLTLSPNTPDSSVLSDKLVENLIPQGCKGCNVSMNSNSPEYSENQMRLKYMRHHSIYKSELDGNPSTSSPKHGFDDNPVTSSTYMEKSPMMHDNCGPIQAGTVSTSNVSHTDALQPPEPSPTPSNSSRSTDTPHSFFSNNSQPQSNYAYSMSSPAYSNMGSCRENFGSNPPTPGSNQTYPYNSPGPPNNNSISGTQMMHFISNHNVNKNLMEVDNISMVGVKPGLKVNSEMFRLEPKKRLENSMPGYCPPPHLGGGPAHSLIQSCYVQSFVTTIATGFSVTRDTVTSVLAGKANTATTSINASQANFIRPSLPPSVNLATTYAIPNNQPDPFLNSVNLPTSYPLHIAGTTAQNMISKSPLEMVQNVISSLPSRPEPNYSQTTSMPHLSKKSGPTTPGQILISSTGQIIVSNNHMPPPPPKITAVSPQSSTSMTNVSTSVNQGASPVPSIVNQSAVVVNTLQAPFVLQAPLMSVDGQVMPQNAVLPQIMTGGIVSGNSSNENSRQIDLKNHHNYIHNVAMVSPEALKKRNKKKKSPSTNITNVLQIAAPQQNSNNIMVHHSSPQHNSSPQFSPRGFQLSPNNISPTPMLQALTILPGKSGTPAHIVMNGQGNANNFGSQQIITNTSPTQQLNLLQPVNLLNNTNMPNFPAFQQFIVPNLSGMVMTADGTLIQDNSTGIPMQLQLQTVNGQNVLTPIQNPGMFAGANNVVIRAQNQPGKIIQQQNSPGAQFLSPNSQVMVNSPNFNGQLSPMLANLSPTFSTSPQIRNNIQTQEFIQTNQMGQLIPVSPKQRNSTFVQNTTIVQQQTTLVSQEAEGEGDGDGEGEAEAEGSVRCSVWTQTRGKSPGAPDTTTLSPGARDPPSPRLYAPAAHHSRHPRHPRHPHADTTTTSPEPLDASSSAMVQCVSSSEPDVAEARPDPDAQELMANNVPILRHNRAHNPVESTDIHYNQTMSSINQHQSAATNPANYYDRPSAYKRKNEFGDGSSYRSDKIMRANYGAVHNMAKEQDYDPVRVESPEKGQSRRYQPSGSSDNSLPKLYDRHNLGSGDAST